MLQGSCTHRSHMICAQAGAVEPFVLNHELTCSVAVKSVETGMQVSIARRVDWCVR